MRAAQSQGSVGKKLFQKKQRATTLLEITIVLAIVGVFLGGVFAAAAMANYRVNFNQASDELNLTTVNMHNLYAGRLVSFTALNALRSLQATPSTGDFNYYTPFYIQQNVFPYEMLSPPVGAGAAPTATTVANTAWGPAQIALAGAADPVEFVIRYSSLSPEICADLITRNSLPGRDTGLTQIIITGSGGTAKTYANTAAASYTLPVTPVNAAAACPTGTGLTYTVDWYYTLSN